MMLWYREGRENHPIWRERMGPLEICILHHQITRRKRRKGETSYL